MKSSELLKSFAPHLIALGAFLALSFIYCSPVLKGYQLSSNDITQFKGAAREYLDHKEKTGEKTHWTNTMFSGMPGYQITGGWEMDLIGVKNLKWLMSKALPKPVNAIFLPMLGFYILLLVLKLDPLKAGIGAIAYGFTSNMIISIEAGHMTKVLTMGFAPFTVAGFLMVIKNNRPYAGIAMFSLFLAFQLAQNHPQITYYTAILLFILGAFEFYSYLKEKQNQALIKNIGFLLIGAILAVGSVSGNLLHTLSYSNQSTRGQSELSLQGQKESSGLDKDYVTRWSYGVAETGTFLIPNFHGGSSMKSFAQEAESETVQTLRRLGPKAQKQEIYQQTTHYWGDQPFTSGPIYLGAIVCLLFLLGALLIKGPIKWWLVTASILATMLAWGRNFELITDLFFNYFPAYNKFRTVTMILFIVQLAFPLLGLLVLHRIVTHEYDKEEVLNKLKIAGGIVTGICLVFALLPGAFFDFLSTANEQVLNPFPELKDALAEDRKSLLVQDAWRSLILVLLAAGGIYAFLNSKIKSLPLVLGIGALILIDLWTVDKRFLNDENFEPARKSNTVRPTPADQRIMQDNEHYRVLNLTVSTFNDATTSFFHNSIGGYHGAKMGRYQELIENGIGPNIQTLIGELQNKRNPADWNLDQLGVINMLNTKYFIATKQAEGVIQNPAALGNAWFVDNAIEVKNADEEILKTSTTNTANIAIYDARYSDYFSGFEINESAKGNIELIEYTPDRLVYKSTSDGDKFAVFSEVFYEGGWQAYLDGEKVDHIRVNYVLRGMKIPAGEHEIVFEFTPEHWQTAWIVSGASTALIALFVLYSLFLEWKRMKED